MKIAAAGAALLALGLGSGCQSNSETRAESAYVIGVTPLGMRLDPIIWGALTHFDIATVDGVPPEKKSRTAVPPGQHTIVVDATSGWSGKSSSLSVTLELKSGHTYMLRPSSFGGLTYLVVIDNDAGMVVARSEVAAVASAAPAASAATLPPPPPPKPDVVENNADGSLKTRGVSETDAHGRVTKYSLYDGAGKLLSTDLSYYGGDGRLVRADHRGPDGGLEKVTVYFDTFAKVLDRDGNVIGTQNLGNGAK
jgi:YD repeat-containing protein